MKRSLAVALLAAGLLLGGCAGLGGDDESNDNPFYGSYSGPWTSDGAGRSGWSIFAVWSDGKLEGPVHDSGSGETRQIEGSLSEDGTVSGTLKLDGQPSTPFNGKVALSSDGNTLSGVLTLRSGGQDIAANFNLTKRWDPEDGYVNGGFPGQGN